MFSKLETSASVTGSTGRVANEITPTELGRRSFTCAARTARPSDASTADKACGRSSSGDASPQRRLRRDRSVRRSRLARSARQGARAHVVDLRTHQLLDRARRSPGARDRDRAALRDRAQASLFDRRRVPAWSWGWNVASFAILDAPQPEAKSIDLARRRLDRHARRLRREGSALGRAGTEYYGPQSRSSRRRGPARFERTRRRHRCAHMEGPQEAEAAVARPRRGSRCSTLRSSRAKARSESRR